MNKLNNLDNISPEVIQKIYQCLFQALGEDYQEAESHLNLETHVSKPFLIWDLIYRNLIQVFSESNVLYSTTKRGMWQVMLLYDKSSNMLLSFMKNMRFKTIRQGKLDEQPQYIRALLTLNADLQAKNIQPKLFEYESNIDDCDDSELNELLNELCLNFSEPIKSEIKHHALVVFSADFGAINELKAYVLDKNLDVVAGQDWLSRVKPILSNEVERATTEEVSRKPLELTDKSMQRIKQKELVGLRDNEEKKDIRHN